MILGTSSAVETATQTVGISQIVLSVAMAASLKAMWNLVNVMQVVTYLKNIPNNPANVEMILKTIHNAITLEHLRDMAYEWQMDSFERASQRVSNEELNSVGITNVSLFWSLGSFALAFVLLLILFGIYYLAKFLRKTFPKLKYVEDKIREKLFYNGFIRYMITANLKLTHTSLFFLAITGTSFDSASDAISSISKVFILVLIVVWNVFITCFIFFNRNRLEKPEFRIKFNSMYDGLKTDNYLIPKAELEMMELEMKEKN